MKKHTLKDIILALVAEYLTDDGKTYNTKHYNLSAIIVVGIRLTRKSWCRSASGYSDFDKFFN